MSRVLAEGDSASRQPDLCASRRAALLRTGRLCFSGPPLELKGQPPQLVGDEWIGGLGRRAAAVLGLVLKILLRGHGRPLRILLVVPGCAHITRAPAFGSVHNIGANSALRRAAMRRNALVMQESLPLCPNCVQPMRLTRRIASDETHHGQNVFECTACRVAMTQTARAESHVTR